MKENIQRQRQRQRQAGRQTDSQACRQTDRQTDRQIDRQTDTQGKRLSDFISIFRAPKSVAMHSMLNLEQFNPVESLWDS